MGRWLAGGGLYVRSACVVGAVAESGGGRGGPMSRQKVAVRAGGRGGGVVSRHREQQAPCRERGGREKESEESEKKVLSNLNPLIFGDHDICRRN